MITQAPVLDRLSALADATRSRLLLVLDGRELTVGEICAVLQLPQSTVSRHLKILTDEGWLSARGDGVSRYYTMAPSRLDAGARRLWHVVRDQMSGEVGAAQDARRLESILAQRRSRSQQFFSTAAGEWDRLRAEMIGERTDLLALLDLLDDQWVVGDLGCGTGHLAAALAPCVGRVIAVDESRQMLSAARQHLSAFDNVELRTGTIEALPIEDAELDAAVLFLVAHFLPDPAQAIREAHRVLQPGGKLLVVDLTPHDRAEYVQQLGHVWQGFDEVQVSGWFEAAGFAAPRYRTLPAERDSKGPAVFAAMGRKQSRTKAQGRTGARVPKDTRKNGTG